MNIWHSATINTLHHAKLYISFRLLLASFSHHFLLAIVSTKISFSLSSLLNMSKVDNGEAAEATTLSDNPRQLNTNNKIKQFLKAVESSLEELVCPISRELPIDPVHGMDGKVYERCEIEKWIQTKKDEGIDDDAIPSPFTLESMDGTTLLDAPHIYNIIEKLINDEKHNNIFTCDLAKSWLDRIKKREDDLKERTELLDKVNDGDTKAMYALALGYVKGLYGLPKDNVQAKKWSKKSSDLNFPPAMCMYGYFCVKHENNIGLGCMLVGSAACLGSNAACDCLGNWYLNGKYGFPKDLQKAEYYFKKAVDGSCKHKHLTEKRIENAKIWLAENEESDD